MNIEEKVKGILSELSGEDTVKSEATLQGDLALDSLSMVTLLIQIEETFGIELDESDMNPFELNTVSSVIELVNKYGGENYEEEC